MDGILEIDSRLQIPILYSVNNINEFLHAPIFLNQNKACPCKGPCQLMKSVS